MMDRRCAWCGRSLHPWHLWVVFAVRRLLGQELRGTTGICPPCEAKLLDEMRTSLKESPPMKTLLLLVLSASCILSLGASDKKWKCETREMEVTAYCPGACCCDGDGKTSTGRSAYKDGVAVDRNIIPTTARLDIPGADTGPNGNGSWLPADDTGSDIVGDIIDLRLQSHRQAKEWGRKKLKVRIWTRAD